MLAVTEGKKLRASQNERIFLQKIPTTFRTDHGFPINRKGIIPIILEALGEDLDLSRRSLKPSRNPTG
jgi:hypothetical protein